MVLIHLHALQHDAVYFKQCLAGSKTQTRWTTFLLFKKMEAWNCIASVCGFGWQTSLLPGRLRKSQPCPVSQQASNGTGERPRASPVALHEGSSWRGFFHTVTSRDPHQVAMCYSPQVLPWDNQHLINSIERLKAHRFHRTLWVARDLINIIQFPPLYHRQGHLPLDRVASSPIQPALNISRDGESIWVLTSNAKIFEMRSWRTSTATKKGKVQITTHNPKATVND